MKVTIIYDNSAYDQELRSDWGFSALVEVEEAPTILFDTGADGEILINNMERLGIDPVSIDELFISHEHYDHTGGMGKFIDANGEAEIYVPPAFSPPGKGRNPRLNVLKEPTKINEKMFSTGELAGIEQSLGVKTEKGIVLIVGCSHPKMENILSTAGSYGEIYGIIGGLHGFSHYEQFKGLELICPSHCTQHKAEIKERYPEKYTRGGAGKVLEIG